MNKIIVDEVEFEIDNIVAALEIKKEKLRLISRGENKIDLNVVNSIDLEIIMLDNSKLDLTIFKSCKNSYGKVVIEQHNSTNIIYKESFVSNNSNKIVVNNKIVGNNNKSDIKLRCISFKGEAVIDVLADVKSGTCGNEIIEDIKGINYGGSVEVNPNMEINTSEVIANHFVTISKISDSDLFYLESKGLSKEKAEELLLDGFLKSILK